MKNHWLKKPFNRLLPVSKSFVNFSRQTIPARQADIKRGFTYQNPRFPFYSMYLANADKILTVELKFVGKAKLSLNVDSSVTAQKLVMNIELQIAQQEITTLYRKRIQGLWLYLSKMIMKITAVGF